MLPPGCPPSASRWGGRSRNAYCGPPAAAISLAKSCNVRSAATTGVRSAPSLSWFLQGHDGGPAQIIDDLRRDRGELARPDIVVDIGVAADQRPVLDHRVEVLDIVAADVQGAGPAGRLVCRRLLADLTWMR
jgi:hypothetical protein